MKIWKPPKIISAKEFVGRRAFGSRVFDRSQSVLPYKIDIFLDNRKGVNLSVDRLGVRQPSRDVVEFLVPLCDSSADKRSSKFVGWAQIEVRQIMHLGVHATEAIDEINPYHAEISRSKHDTNKSKRSLAFELCVHASKHSFLDRSLQ